jgi:hypothetical protein
MFSLGVELGFTSKGLMTRQLDRLPLLLPAGALMLIKASAPGLFPLTGGFFMSFPFNWLTICFNILHNTDFVRTRKESRIKLH